MTTQDMLDERYGRTSSPARRWTIGIFSVIAAILVGLFAWMTISSTLDDVGVDTTGFTVQDQRTVELAFQITRADRTHRCVRTRGAGRGPRCRRLEDR